MNNIFKIEKIRYDIDYNIKCDNKLLKYGYDFMIEKEIKEKIMLIDINDKKIIESINKYFNKDILKENKIEQIKNSLEFWEILIIFDVIKTNKIYIKDENIINLIKTYNNIIKINEEIINNSQKYDMRYENLKNMTINDVLINIEDMINKLNKNGDFIIKIDNYYNGNIIIIYDIFTKIFENVYIYRSIMNIYEYNNIYIIGKKKKNNIKIEETVDIKKKFTINVDDTKEISKYNIRINSFINGKNKDIDKIFKMFFPFDEKELKENRKKYFKMSE